jgi:hypothetical protein
MIFEHGFGEKCTATLLKRIGPMSSAACTRGWQNTYGLCLRVFQSRFDCGLTAHVGRLKTAYSGGPERQSLKHKLDVSSRPELAGFWRMR